MFIPQRFFSAGKGQTNVKTQGIKLHFGDREYNREPSPEWMDGGPSNVDELIELKGLDDEEPKERQTPCKPLVRDNII